jgi:hypothetical protein
MVSDLRTSDSFMVNQRYLPGQDEKTRRSSYIGAIDTLGSLVTSPDNSGLVLIDQSGSPIKNKDGSDVYISFEDIQSMEGQLKTESATGLSQKEQEASDITATIPQLVR